MSGNIHVNAISLKDQNYSKEQIMMSSYQNTFNIHKLNNNNYPTKALLRLDNLTNPNPSFSLGNRLIGTNHILYITPIIDHLFIGNTYTFYLNTIQSRDVKIVSVNNLELDLLVGTDNIKSFTPTSDHLDGVKIVSSIPNYTINYTSVITIS